MTITFANNTHPGYDNVKALNIAAEQLSQFNVEDSTYGNDSCPSILVWINEGTETYLQLFIDYKNPELREEEEMLEFCVTLYEEGDMQETEDFDSLDLAIDHITEKTLSFIN